ncbi:MAG: patatin-like phospholipase family protein [Xanthomonadales bacterium]|jgi:NTE family protein|nr:patatin-like phospholipase family protein [Xanthomonadales bacterium]
MSPDQAPSVALVLGAGGARGLAHIGVIEAIEARGLRIAAIAGSSMGALVGGIYASGRLPAYRDWALALSRTDVFRLLDFGIGRPGLFTGDRLMDELQEIVGQHRIESLPIPFTAVATDLRAQREVWLTRGSLFDAIRASMAIPLVFTPVKLGGRELVDGGLLNPVPIAAMRQALADVVIAVDVNARVANAHGHASQIADGGDRESMRLPVMVDAEDGVEKETAGSMFAQWFTRKAAEQAQTGLIDLMARSLDTMQGQLSRMQLAFDPPDILVRISRDSSFFYEFWRTRELIEIGRKQADDALDAAGY